LALVATEGDEVEELGSLEAFEAGRHGGGRSLHPVLTVGAGEESRAGSANGLHPTLRKVAKDGAPEILRLVKGGPPAKLISDRPSLRRPFLRGL
jgi:hypothetical protein